MSNDIDILARTIFGEARGELFGGKVAVANVVINRAAERTLTVAEVCQQPHQFSCWNVGDVNREIIEAVTDDNNSVFQICLSIAGAVFRGEIPDTTFGSRHYHTITSNPSWSRGHVPVVRIGAHFFYNDVR